MNDNEKQVVAYYQQQEKEMILLFAQWCINNALDPKLIYLEAYPDQMTNDLLEEVLQDTVEANESVYIAPDLLLQVLQSFGNDDLAFIVADYIEKLNRNLP